MKTRQLHNLALWQLVKKVTAEIAKEETDNADQRTGSEADKKVRGPETECVQMPDRVLDDWMGSHLRR